MLKFWLNGETSLVTCTGCVQGLPGPVARNKVHG